MDPIHALLTRRDSVGALSRHVDVIVLEISRSGCLLEAPSQIAPGTLAMVRVHMDGAEYSDAVRVTRSQAISGAGERYRLGAEFVWLWPAEDWSLRRLASRITGHGDGPTPLATSR